MNSNADSDPINDTTNDPVAPRPAPSRWREWGRRLFVCNPFFLCSAALLLLAINRLSTDDRLFRSDLHNLIFNFFSLQSYQAVVVGTALVLARRRIWYDSSLLVVLDSGLALVPFMLISQASLEGNGVAWTLSAAGGLMAALRFTGVRHWFPEFNLPGRALLMGMFILILNVALPLVFRPTVETDLDNWIRPNEIFWAFVLPLVAAGANLLPRPVHCGDMEPHRPWLPILIYALWTVGSGVHAWCIAHICGLPLKLYHLAPVVCVAAWTLHHRLTDCIRLPSMRWQLAVLTLTTPAPLLAFGHAEAFVLFGAINLPGYLLLSSKGRTAEIRRMARHLALGTLALMVAAFPGDWLTIVAPELSRVRVVFIAVAFHLAVVAALSSHPMMALPGALGFGTACALLWAQSPHQPMQLALAFVVAHSLRWVDDRHPAIRLVRRLAIAAWIVESFLWTRPLAPFDRDAMIGGLTVLIAWTLGWWNSGHRKTLWIPGGAIASMLAAPAHSGLQRGSSGVLSLIGSFLLFALGAWVAWNRHRWNRPTLPIQDSHEPAP